MKVLVPIVLFCIVVALFTGLFGLLKAQNGSRHTVQSLTIRVGLSVGLFLLLIVGALLGWWRPHQL